MTVTLPHTDPTQALGSAPLLRIDDLVVSYTSGGRRTPVVHGVTLQVRPGEVVALVGESGSGKTTTAQAVIGLLAENGHVEGGRITLGEEELTGRSERALRGIRGRRIGLVPQDPNNSLSPVHTIGESLAEVLRIHRWGSREAIEARVLALLDHVGLDDPPLRARQYPHELSGGMKQRVLIAAAIAMEPDLIIADEPTSALDVTVQRRVLDLLDRVRSETGAAILLVTHDLGVARERADRIVVMRAGHVVEQGPTSQVVEHPRDEYTRGLLADAAALAGVVVREPSRHRPTEAPDSKAAIRVTDLVQAFDRGRGRPPFLAVDAVSLSVPPGTTHALVGESGSGKTTLARAVLGFRRPTSGQVRVAGIDVTGARGRRALHPLRRAAQLVLQNPYSSLDPRQRIGDIIAEPLLNHRIGDRAERRRLVAEQLDRVALPHSVVGRLPRELSGGQRQRVAIARALVLQPQVVVLDEPTSALDVTVQAQILRLLAQLQDELHLTYLFISHDLGVVAHLSDSVTVLRAGRVVEHGPTAEVFCRPRAAYTADLLAAIPGR